MGIGLTKSEVDLMLWVINFENIYNLYILLLKFKEIDENLDKKIYYREFESMYKRCINDT